MSHIHLPDGILPIWLWASGFVLAILISLIFLRRSERRGLSRRLPLLGMAAAVMVLGASVEIVPIAYHVNLTAISGILLGPSLIFLATFVVNLILALFGHGGVTVIGLNTLTLSMEGILAYFFFRLFWRGLKKLGLAAFLATFLALLFSTLSMIGVVGLGTSHYEELIHQEKETGIFEFKLLKGNGEHPDEAGDKRGEKSEVNLSTPRPEGRDLPFDKLKAPSKVEGLKVHPEQRPSTPPSEAGARAAERVNLRRFMAVVLPLGFIGWVLEGVITALIARYLYRLRPDLLKLERETR